VVDTVEVASERSMALVVQTVAVLPSSFIVVHTVTVLRLIVVQTVAVLPSGFIVVHTVTVLRLIVVHTVTVLPMVLVVVHTVAILPLGFVVPGCSKAAVLMGVEHHILDHRFDLRMVAALAKWVESKQVEVALVVNTAADPLKQLSPVAAMKQFV
jgi:hypothetical protein